MHKQLCMAAAFASLAIPAFAADECGPMPIAPAMPTVAEFQVKTVEDSHQDLLAASKQVKTYQAALKTYRACLVQMTSKDVTAMAEAKAKKEEARAKELQSDIDARNLLNDKTVQNETQVATDFNALIKLQCDRGDEKLSTCKKR